MYIIKCICMGNKLKGKEFIELGGLLFVRSFQTYPHCDTSHLTVLDRLPQCIPM